MFVLNLRIKKNPGPLPLQLLRLFLFTPELILTNRARAEIVLRTDPNKNLTSKLIHG
jgi:hypothetical protein